MSTSTITFVSVVEVLQCPAQLCRGVRDLERFGVQPCRFESNLCSEAVRWIGEPTHGGGSQESVLLTRTTICEDTEQYQLNTKLVDLSDFLLEQRLPRILTYHSEKSSRRRSSMMRRCKMWSSTCASSFPIRRVLLCVCPVWASDRARVWATCFLDDWSRRAV